METRSRKRAEVSSSAPSSSSGPSTRLSKRARLSSPPAGVVSASASALPSPLISSISTRSRASRSHDSLVSSVASMDLENDSSGSAARRDPSSRRGKDQASSKGNLGNGIEKDDRGGDSRARTSDIGVNVDSGGGDGNDSETGVGILHQNLTSASSALQGLLRKLGAGFDDLLPSSASTSASHQSGTLKKILSGLRADGEEGKQIEALTQLCEILCIGSEDSLGTFSVDSFVPVLVGLLNRESNPDIMLLAARAITHLCDVLPSSCSAVVHYGAVPSFCARLLTIEYMDLAEQSLQALKKISQEHPTACLRAGALMAVLSYLDFFSTGVQRVALSTAANMCKKLPSDAADFVMEAVPLLTNLLQYHDAKVLEHASICLTRISEAFASSPDKLDELCNHGLVAQAVSLISSSNSGTVQSALGTSTYTGLIRMLATFACSSPLGGKTLLLLGISGILKEILCSSSLSTSVSVSPTLNRPPDQIFEIVNLANELLPPLPEGILFLPLPSGIVTGGSLFQKSPSGNSEKNGNASRGPSREKLLKERPDLLEQFGLDFLPVLVQIFGSSVNSSVRNKCLLVMGKLMYFSSSDMIQSLLSVTNLASFLAGILTWRDPHAIVPALQMAEILMDKLPSTFSNMFLREGVVHAVDMLIQDAAPFDGSSPAGKNHDPLQGTLSRSRRSRAIPSDGGAGSVTLPPSSLEMSGSNPNLRTTVGGRAKVFKEKFFPLDSQSSGAGVTEDLIKLKALCKKLNDAMDDQKGRGKGKSKVSEPSSSIFCAVEEENLAGIVGEILCELSRGDGVSTFEFIGSGVVDTFLNYFSFGLEKIPDDAVPKLRQQALKRSRSFVSVALPLNGGSVLPMSSLVQKLHSALASLERFPVVLSSAVRSSTSGGNPRSSSGLSILMQTVNLRLCRARDDTSLEDFSSNVVEIALLANISEIEAFLWPRVHGNGSLSGTGTPPVAAPLPSPAHRHSARLRSSSASASDPRKRQVQCKLASSKGKGKGLLKLSRDDNHVNNNNNATGPQTRNSTRRRASSGKVVNEVESSSEDVDPDPPTDLLDTAFMVGGGDDDDDDVSDDDDDDDDDDDVDVSEDVLRELSFPTGNYRRVHDVKLSEGDDAGESVRNPSAVIGSASLAFAAMAAGIVSSDGIAERDGDQKLTFAGAGGKPLSRNLTIYQAIQRKLVVPEEEETERHTAGGSDGGKFFSGTYSITYQRGRNPEPTNSSGTGTGAGSVASRSKSKSKVKAAMPAVLSQKSGVTSEPLLDTVLRPRIPGDVEKSVPTHGILALLRVLDALNRLVPSLDSDGEGCRPRLARDEFVSSKLTPKLTRQVQDTAVLCNGSVPSWCHSLTSACPFLFPFETRRQYFYSTAFGVSRALYRLQQQGHGSSSSRELRLGRLQRQKVRVSRNRILDSAVKVMEMYSAQKSVLEVEYFGEVGTGLGPTLEFYTLLSHELQKPELGIWRPAAPDASLFPCPRHDDARLTGEYFRLLGRVVAKALKDGRLLDIPLSPAFYKLVLCEELAAHDVCIFDPALGRTLKDLTVIVRRKKFLESAGRSDEIPALSLHGVPIEDLCLDFSLPGYPDYPVKGGAKNVTVENLEEYVGFVTDVTLNAGIRRQMEAFHAGFNQVFNIASLRIFSPDELDYLLCGRREMWQADTLVDYIKFDHGYTAKSPVILNLLEIMGELKPDEQRAFCQFVTGAPRLPPGGLSALNPRLTIVRKHSSSGGSARNGSSDSSDHDLPSVMTCANYLKLPPYSTKEIMYKKLMYAVSEGQGSFDLS